MDYFVAVAVGVYSTVGDGNHVKKRHRSQPAH